MYYSTIAPKNRSEAIRCQRSAVSLLAMQLSDGWIDDLNVYVAKIKCVAYVLTYSLH